MSLQEINDTVYPPRKGPSAVPSGHAGGHDAASFVLMKDEFRSDAIRRYSCCTGRHCEETGQGFILQVARPGGPLDRELVSPEKSGGVSVAGPGHFYAAF